MEIYNPELIGYKFEWYMGQIIQGGNTGVIYASISNPDQNPADK
jgi:hypothetical protein